MEILETKTDIGLIRNQNEDTVVAIKHPRNKNIKLLLAADGMGGREFGEIASSYIAKSLTRWFYNKDIRTLNNTKRVEQLLKKYIKKLNTNLIRKYGEDTLGTTLTLGIINKNNTLIINIGDSRAYIYKKKKLLQITEDDSDVWDYYKYGNVKKDYLRFFPNNSIITACIGICSELCKITTLTIENDYEMLLLFTDGVTDNITDKKINKIIKKTPKEYLLGDIINEAVYVDQHFHIPLSLKIKYKNKYILPFKGRDNASGVIYIKEA